MSFSSQVRNGANQPDQVDHDELFIQHDPNSNKILGLWAGAKNDQRKCIKPLGVQHPGNGNDYAMKPEDNYVGADTNDSTATITTPPTEDIPDGHQITVDDEGGNATNNAITVDTPGSETIEDSATLSISTNDGTAVLEWDKENTNWVQIL